MSLQQDSSQEGSQEQEKSTVRYLRDNPDFFERHLDLLADMILPHESGKAVSLIERQVSVLRDQKDEHKKKLQTLIANAQQNELLVNKLNQLILDMLDTSTLDQLINLVEHRLKADFKADQVKVRLMNSNANADNASWSKQELEVFEKVVNKRTPLCGRLKQEEMQALFADEAEPIKSVALLPLSLNSDSKQCIGLVAIGSHNETRFTADMDTLFLSHMARVFTRMINQHINS